MQTRKAILTVSILITALFILAQFVFRHSGSMGPWCSPALDAPRELGYPMYQFVDYGFPIPTFESLTNDCSEPNLITFDWLPLVWALMAFCLY